jgi:hypothetical protein
LHDKLLFAFVEVILLSRKDIFMSINIKFEKFVVKGKFKKSVLKRSLFTPVHRCCMAVLELLH